MGAFRWLVISCPVLALAAACSSGGGGGSFSPAPHPSYPALSFGGSGLLSPMKLVTVVESGDPLTSNLFAFGDALVGSQWWQAVSADYHLAPPSASIHVTGASTAGASMTVASMESYVAGLVAGSQAPPPDGNTLYLFYLPDGVVADFGTNGGLNTSCRLAGGVHYGYDAGGDGFAWVQRCSFEAPDKELPGLTRIASHEILEAATDTDRRGYGSFRSSAEAPWTQDVWLSYEAGGHDEIGDLCEGTEIEEGGFSYQRIWSLSAAAAGGDACLPHHPGAFVSASVPADWYSVQAGSSVSIPVTAWSTSAAAPWLVGAYVKYSSLSADQDGFEVAVQAPGEVAAYGTQYALTNGETATLQVSAPSEVVSGDFAVLLLTSSPPDPDGEGDRYHFWPVGVYVP